MDINFYTESREIVRGKYNVIPVSYTKGLEIEKVIVLQTDMDRNQFYVACTRAIGELYVVTQEQLPFSYVPEDVISSLPYLKENERNDVGREREDTDSVVCEIDLSSYQVFSYSGKLKKVIGAKNTPLTYLNLRKGQVKKQIPISYVEETKCAYIADSIFKSNRELIKNILLRETLR